VGKECSRRETMNDFRRLNIIVEGQTEERFVKDTLSLYLGNFSISTNVRCVETGRNKSTIFRGGLFKYQKARGDIIKWMKEDQNQEVFFTTMFDLYALPKDFPSNNGAQVILDPYHKVNFLEKEFASDITDRRFIPYLQLHEFESLLFVKPSYLGEIFFEEIQNVAKLEEIVRKYGDNPEMINDGFSTAPSKRIIQLFPSYDSQKPTAGAKIAEMIGISELKGRCKHFGEWISKLENLGK
jgi:hypothetical protein